MSEKRKSKSRKWIIIGVVIVLVLIIAIQAFVNPKQIPYESVEAKTGDITTYYSFSGNVQTKNRQIVMSAKSLQIYDIKVDEGDIVEEDQELIRTTAGDRIRANIAGEVVNIDVEDNEQVMSGMQLLEVVDYDNLQIKVKIDEYNLSAVQKGKETTVMIGALEKEVVGTISSISKEGEVSNGVTYFTATIDLEKDKVLKPGMSAEVKIINNQAQGVVTIPIEVVQFHDNNKPYVLIEDKEGSIIEKEIITGINDGVTVEIKKGVSKDENVYYPNNESVVGPGFNPQMGVQ